MVIMGSVHITCWCFVVKGLCGLTPGDSVLGVMRVLLRCSLPPGRARATRSITALCTPNTPPPHTQIDVKISCFSTPDTPQKLYDTMLNCFNFASILSNMSPGSCLQTAIYNPNIVKKRHLSQLKFYTKCRMGETLTSFLTRLSILN